MQEMQKEIQDRTVPAGPNKKHNHFVHTLIMLACCVLPVLIFAVFSFFNFRNNAITNLTWLLCPAGMLLMMGLMFFTHQREKKADGHEQNSCQR